MTDNNIDLSQFTFKPGIDYEYETRLKMDMISFRITHMRVNKRYGQQVNRNDSVDYYVEGDDHRYTTQDNVVFTKMLKTRIRSVMKEGVKYSLSSEKTSDTPSLMLSDDKQSLIGDGQKLMITNIRKKSRIEYNVDDVAIHLTEVRDGNNVVTSYEVEVEADPSSEDFDVETFNEIATTVYDNDLASLSTAMNRIKIPQLTDFNQLHRPIDLKIDNIIDGDVENMVISKKPDGEQRFLVINNNAAWFVFPGTRSIMLGKTLEDHKDCVVAGELVVKGGDLEVPSVKTIIFIPFDLLYLDGKDMRQSNYKSRVVEFKKVIKKQIKLSMYEATVINKKFTPCKNTTQFFKSIKSTMETGTRYETDGVIITPAGPYGNFDIYKWKPRENLTIDAKLADGRYYLSRYNRSSRQRENIPYDDRSTKLANKITFRNTINLPDGIIEFEPLFDENDIVMEDDKVVLTSKRTRPDKMFPNAVGVVSKLHSLIINPILEETIKGESTVLMRRYHNAIKRQILANTDQNSYLIDIGAGKGGDISKWDNFQRILAVEPDSSYVSEFRKRLSERPSVEKRVDIVNTSAEDTEKILQGLNSWGDVGDSTVYISFMFSFGFLWDPERFDGMVKTITGINDKLNTKCKILFITIDGQRLKSLFDESGDTLKLNTISLERIDTNAMNITIDDSKTVTRQQTEYFVYPRQLFSKLGYTFIPKYAAERGMSENEKTYNNLVIFGEAYFNNEPTTAKRLPVSSKEAIIDSNGKIRMRGEDAIALTDFDTNMFRVATLDQSISSVHSALKLTSERYRNAKTPQDQVKMAQDTVNSLDYDNSLIKLAIKLEVTIKVIEGDSVVDTFNPDTDSTIFLYRHGEDESYEPVVKKLDDGNMCMVFEPKWLQE